jgi:hypothetical protein
MRSSSAPPRLGVGPEAVGALLDGLEQETETALRTGYSANPRGARLGRHGPGGPASMRSLTRPFFASLTR